MVISTPTVSYNTPLVWYAHFIFYSVYISACGDDKKLSKMAGYSASYALDRLAL